MFRKLVNYPASSHVDSLDFSHCSHIQLDFIDSMSNLSTVLSWKIVKRVPGPSISI